ncbi:hypothetical protein [Pseudidiomarina sp. YC-516-91]|uniref:hypothetical protein n=1 Tax=Pseudidiomarina salilacus TaxID=3384452 RepID=UPI0039854DBF
MKTLLMGMTALITVAAAAAENSYTVHATLLSNGKVVGEPVLQVRDAEPASIEVSGVEGYSLALTVTAENTPGRYRLVSEVSTAGSNMSPTLVVEANQPAEVSIGQLTMRVTVRE